VVVEDPDSNQRECFSKVVIDASGRDAVAINQFGWRERDPELNKFAIWTYYRGAVREEGHDEGATTVAYLPEKGWFWHIPLPDGVSSVGVVADKQYLFSDTKDLPAILDREIQKNAWLAQHLAPGEQFGDYHVTSDFSYRSRYCAMEGLILAGDAFAFLDPVFSSGVFLALKSGEMAADAVEAALIKEDVSGEQFAQYGSDLCKGIEAMRKLVYVFYDQAFRFGDMLKKYPDLREDLTDCLIGHLYRDFVPLFSAIEEFVQVPDSLAHGGVEVPTQ